MNGGVLLRQLDWLCDKLAWGERVSKSDWDRRYYRTLRHAANRSCPKIKAAIRGGMLLEEFNQFADEFITEQWSLLEAKGADYTDGGAEGGDRLANFKEEAEALGVSPLQIWAVFAGKHWRALCTFVRNGSLRSESVRSRFLDLANYALLGAALVEEEDALTKTVEPPEEDDEEARLEATIPTEHS